MSDPLKIYVGDTATRLEIDTELDLTSATSLLIKAKKPSGAFEDWPAEMIVGQTTKMRCTEPAGFFDEAGIWEFHAYAVFPGGVLHGNLCSQKIHALWS